MVKSTIRIVCFIIILVMVLGYTNKVFKVKYDDGIYGLTRFYELEEETVDVLILGSSHAFANIDEGILWDEYGIASYALGGSSQPMWNTYYYLKEALKTQTPEVIVLEGYRTIHSSEFTDDSRIIKNNYGLKWSCDKINSIKISSSEERWSDFLLEYTQYHTRYRELMAGDFLKNKGDSWYEDWKGFYYAKSATPVHSIDVSNVTGRISLHEKTEKYYRATLELAQEKGNPIIVVISPYAGINEREQQIYNSASDIAAEYDIPFINCNLFIDDIGIDYSTDAAEQSHLNYKGIQKYSKYLGKYLKNRFQISDRTGDAKYDTWKRNADYTSQMIADQVLNENYDINDILELIQNSNYRIIISVDGNCNSSDKNLRFFFDKMGIYGESLNGIWLKEENEIVWYSGMDEAKYFIEDSSHDFHMKRSLNDFCQYVNAIIFDNVQYQKVDNGVNVFVFNKKTDKIADIFGINMDDGYSIVK